jgi:AcrR family transcriptional regulator
MKSVKPPMTPTRESYHHGDLRRTLLDTALELIAERGAEGFSLREAARAVGVSPAAAYRHFADKPALLVALAAEGHGRLAAAMEKAVARLPTELDRGARALAAFSAIGHAYVEFAVRNPSFFRVMFGPAMKEEGFEPCCAPSGRDAYDILGFTLDEVVRTEVIPAASRPGGEIVAWSTVHGFATLLVDGALPMSPRERAVAYQLLARNLLVGMGCDPARLPAPDATGLQRFMEAKQQKMRAKRAQQGAQRGG